MTEGYRHLGASEGLRRAQKLGRWAVDSSQPRSGPKILGQGNHYFHIFFPVSPGRGKLWVRSSLQKSQTINKIAFNDQQTYVQGSRAGQKPFSFFFFFAFWAKG